MVSKKFLSFEGLEKYDKLIKSYIALSNKSLSDDVDVLKEEVKDLKNIDHDAYKLADSTLETSLKGYVDNAVATASETDIDNLFDNIRIIC
jgi:hypothetical protein